MRFPRIERFDPAQLAEAVRRRLDVGGAELQGLAESERVRAAAAMQRARGWLDQLAARPKLSLFGELGPGSKADVGWALALDPGHADRVMTDDFLRLHEAARANDRRLPANANDYAYLFVPGLFTERYLGYMSDNVRRLRELGCENVGKSAIDTDAGVRTNAAQLREELLALAAETGKKVIVIGHSKGGVDAAAAFELYPELAEHVHAFVSMQAPFAGTPIASDIGDCPEIAQLMSAFVRDIFRGNPAALADLAYDARRAFLGDRVTFTDRIRTFSFATASSDPASLTALPALYVRNRYDAPNDGLVAQKDAIIPGSRGIVLLDELDHAMPAMRGPFQRKQPGDITQALVTLALTR